MADYKAEKQWFRNLSGIDIPSEIKGFLALGPKFSLPSTHNNCIQQHKE